MKINICENYLMEGLFIDRETREWNYLAKVYPQNIPSHMRANYCRDFIIRDLVWKRKISTRQGLINTIIGEYTVDLDNANKVSYKKNPVGYVKAIKDENKELADWMKKHVKEAILDDFDPDDLTINSQLVINYTTKYRVDKTVSGDGIISERTVEMDVYAEMDVEGLSFNFTNEFTV